MKSSEIIRKFATFSYLTIKSYQQAFTRYLKITNDELPTNQSLKRFVIGMRESGLKEMSCNISMQSFNPLTNLRSAPVEFVR